MAFSSPPICILSKHRAVHTKYVFAMYPAVLPVTNNSSTASSVALRCCSGDATSDVWCIFCHRRSRTYVAQTELSINEARSGLPWTEPSSPPSTLFFLKGNLECRCMRHTDTHNTSCPRQYEQKQLFGFQLLPGTGVVVAVVVVMLL